MSLHPDQTGMSLVSDLLLTMFPYADRIVVSSLSGQIDPLVRYLAQVHEVTLSEVREVIDAFCLRSPAGLRVTI